jgi:hypothetical protein
MVAGIVIGALTPSVHGATPTATQENVRLLATVPGNTGGHLVVEGNRLYMGNYGTGLSAYDITNPRAPVKIGQYLPGPSNTDGADPGARADTVPDAAVWNGKHIVTLGGTSRASTTTQTEFLDFTNPASPQLLWRFRGGADGEAHNGDIVDSRKLWLPSGGGGNNGLRIYDMSPLLNTPPAAPIKLFAGNPHSLWQASQYRTYYGKSTGGTFNHTHDIEVYADRNILLPEWEWVDQNGDQVPDPTFGLRDIALLAAAGGGNTSGAVYVIDITTPASPVVISKWQNPSAGTNTPISYLHEAQFLNGDPNTIFVADENLTSGCNAGRLYTFNISDDLVHTTKLAEWAIGAGAQDLPVCAGSHVFSSNDRHVFMGAYVAGLQIVDLRDPAQPRRAGRYIAEGMNSWGALYHAGVVYTGDFGARGLDVFEFIQDPVAKAYVKAPNPGTRQTGGIAETGCRNSDPYGPTNGTDGLIVPIPESAADGTHKMRAVGSSLAPYDLDIWFHTGTNCTSMGFAGGTDGTDALETIPEGATMASIDLYTGTAQWVYAQILP